VEIEKTKHISAANIENENEVLYSFIVYISIHLI
jgi:hypothetical protein